MAYNKAYHRYFEGYVEKEVWDPSTGKMRIERIYAGSYYRHKLTDKQWVWLKITYAAVLIWLAVCLLVQGLCRNTVVWYTVVPLLLGVISLIWFGFYDIYYIVSKRTLMIREYREREMLKATAMANVICFGLNIAGQIAWMILNRYLYIWGILCCITDLGAIGAGVYIFRKERDMEYLKYDNDTPIPDDSYDIRYYEE